MVKSLGILTLTAGTPVRLTANLPAPTQREGAQRIQIFPVPANAGVVYVGMEGMVIATGVQLLGAIPKPASATTGPFEPFTLEEYTSPNGFDAAQIFVDGTTNDQVIAYLTNG